MDGVLSQEEISALLNDPNSGADSGPRLTDIEKDAIGEISNISMGTAATTLFSLVNRKVEISTPVVSYATWDDLSKQYERPCVFIRIAYTVGLDGSNILVLKENDVNIMSLSLADTTEYGLLRLIVNNPEKGKEMLSKAGHWIPHKYPYTDQLIQ